MPFTPFHMGPGLAVKAITGRHFSVLVFGIAQVAMDIEPLVGMIRGSEILHGWSHTYIGATLIGLLVMLIAPPLCRVILSKWNDELIRSKLDWLGSPNGIGPIPAATGALIGTYSHVALDSIMHLDIQPLRPWSIHNSIQGYVSISNLHLLCIIAGLIGIALWILTAFWRTRK